MSKKNDALFYVGKKRRSFLSSERDRNVFEVFPFLELKGIDQPSLEDQLKEWHRNTYEYILGPFKTKEGADYCRSNGGFNDNCNSVDDAEERIHGIGR